MKQRSSYSSWDFTTIWDISPDRTYPALLGVSNNAPFAFSDTLTNSDTLTHSDTPSLLANDYDYETGQDSLICKLVGVSTKGSLRSDGVYSFNPGIGKGIKDTISYCVGELLAHGDTLWGNEAVSILTQIHNNAPVLVSTRDTTMFENTSLVLSLDHIIVNDVDESDVLSLFILAGEHYTMNAQTIIPSVGYYGTLTVPVYVSDGVLNTDTVVMTITVIPAPDPTIITWESPESGVYGTVIGSEAMDATASNDEGVISYSFATDSIFEAGTYQLIATFKPNNSDEYMVASDTVEYMVGKAMLMVTAENQTMTEGDELPELSMTYVGFVNGDSESDLDVVPTISTLETTESEAGKYTITVSGGSDQNYDFTYVEGTLTISPYTATSELSVITISVYPNPVTTVLTVTGSTGVASLYTLAGIKVLVQDLSQSNRINLSGLCTSVYILHVDGINIKVIKK